MKNHLNPLTKKTLALALASMLAACGQVNPSMQMDAKDTAAMHASTMSMTAELAKHLTENHMNIGVNTTSPRLSAPYGRNAVTTSTKQLVISSYLMIC